MHRPRRLRHAVLAAATLSLALVTAPIAQAAPTAGERTGGPVPHPAATTPAEQRAVISYWTPARMRAAVPKAKKAGPTKGKPGTSSDAEAVQVPTDPRFGKVFFTEKGINYVCSGTATTASNQSLVTTAGHCVNEGPGAYVTNFAFVPAYLDGATPYGTWVASSLVTTDQWKNSGDLNHDLGFAVMAPQGGSTLQGTTGSFDIAFNLGYGLTFEAYGYPQARPYDGRTLWKCSGPTTEDTRGSTDNRLPCTMTGGSSGGGWITSDGGKRVLNSLNSFGYRGEKDVMYGPYFGNVEHALYSTAQG